MDTDDLMAFLCENENNKPEQSLGKMLFLEHIGKKDMRHLAAKDSRRQSVTNTERSAERKELFSDDDEKKKKKKKEKKKKKKKHKHKSKENQKLHVSKSDDENAKTDVIPEEMDTDKHSSELLDNDEETENVSSEAMDEREEDRNSLEDIEQSQYSHSDESLHKYGDEMEKKSDKSKRLSTKSSTVGSRRFSGIQVSRKRSSPATRDRPRRISFVLDKESTEVLNKESTSEEDRNSLEKTSVEDIEQSQYPRIWTNSRSLGSGRLSSEPVFQEPRKHPSPATGNTPRQSFYSCCLNQESTEVLGKESPKLRHVSKKQRRRSITQSSSSKASNKSELTVLLNPEHTLEEPSQENIDQIEKIQGSRSLSTKTLSQDSRRLSSETTFQESVKRPSLASGDTPRQISLNFLNQESRGSSTEVLGQKSTASRRSLNLAQSLDQESRRSSVVVLGPESRRSSSQTSGKECRFFVCKQEISSTKSGRQKSESVRSKTGCSISNRVREKQQKRNLDKRSSLSNETDTAKSETYTSSVQKTCILSNPLRSDEIYSAITIIISVCLYVLFFYVLNRTMDNIIKYR